MCVYVCVFTYVFICMFTISVLLPQKTLTNTALYNCNISTQEAAAEAGNPHCFHTRPVKA